MRERLIVERAVSVEFARRTDDEVARTDLHPLVAGLDKPPASRHDDDLSAEVDVRRGGTRVTGRHDPHVQLVRSMGPLQPGWHEASRFIRDGRAEPGDLVGADDLQRSASS
jgi:hypothetical protein